MKMPGKKRPAVRPVRRKPKAKLNASVSRTASRGDFEEYEDEEYYESEGPNLRLSHAFFVVLILHIIAVAGVFGFSAMKSRQSSIDKLETETAVVDTAAEETVSEKVESTSAVEVKDPSPPVAANTAPANHEVVAGDTLTRIAAKYGVGVEAIEAANNLNEGSVIRVGQTLSIPAKESAPVAAAPASKAADPPAPAPAPKSEASTPPAPTDSGEVYEVVAGDNPYSIAKRHGVSYQELLEINNIEDPTKLQIGQELKIPAKSD